MPPGGALAACVRAAWPPPLAAPPGARLPPAPLSCFSSVLAPGEGAVEKLGGPRGADWTPSLSQDAVRGVAGSPALSPLPSRQARCDFAVSKDRIRDDPSPRQHQHFEDPLSPVWSGEWNHSGLEGRSLWGSPEPSGETPQGDSGGSVAPWAGGESPGGQSWRPPPWSKGVTPWRAEKVAGLAWPGPRLSGAQRGTLSSGPRVSWACTGNPDAGVGTGVAPRGWVRITGRVGPRGGLGAPPVLTANCGRPVGQP